MTVRVTKLTRLAAVPECSHPMGHQWAERISQSDPYRRYCTRSACGLVIEGPWSAPMQVRLVKKNPAKRLPPIEVPSELLYGTRTRAERLLAVLQHRDGAGCFYCRVPLASPTPRVPNAGTVDHYVPRGSGGRNSLDNLRAACFACNHQKGDLSPADFNLVRIHGKKRGRQLIAEAETA